MSRPPTPFLLLNRKTWVPATSAGMTQSVLLGHYTNGPGRFKYCVVMAFADQ
jgi:hypothetical protein